MEPCSLRKCPDNQHTCLLWGLEVTAVQWFLREQKGRVTSQAETAHEKSGTNNSLERVLGDNAPLWGLSPEDLISL